MIVPWFTSYAHSNKIMGVVMAEQWLDCLCVGHFFRFITYTSTSLPGPASHCRPGAPEPEVYRPTEPITFFTRKASSEEPNCGDLIFSGHMFQDVILCIILTRYATKVMREFVKSITRMILKELQNNLLLLIHIVFYFFLSFTSFLFKLITYQ